MLMPRYSDQRVKSESSYIGNHSQDSATPSTTVAPHTKMRLLNKVEQNLRQHQNQSQVQDQSIHKIINTAATGNSVVGDVDELLTPMSSSIQSHQPYIPSLDGGYAGSSNSGFNSSGSSNSGGKEAHARPERNLWSRAEMLEMLDIMQQMNALDQLNDRNVKSEHVFRQIEEVMRRKGYVKKSSIQIWTKWKFLKSTYNTTTRHGNGIPKVVPEEVYRVLCRMLREHANANTNASANGSNIGSENGNSMDSSSNVDLRRSMAGGVDIKPGSAELGVEHPIFGFRLGLVKSEPQDTGYETQMRSTHDIEAVDFMDQQPHEPFIINVKHEPEMDLGVDANCTNTLPPTAPATPSPPTVAMESEEPPPLCSSTPLPLPPLRVASFAQRPLGTPTHGILQIERPPPPLSKGKGQRSVMGISSINSINFAHPTSKLMLPRKQMPLRMPRAELSMQASTHVRPLKSVPMRETGYSLRPDRMIPDLDHQSISPPPSPPLHAAKYQLPSTSRQAQMLSEQQRKRRLNQVHSHSPVPVKLQRSSTLLEPKYPISAKLRDEPAQQQQPKPSNEEEAQRQQQQRKQQQEEHFKTELSNLATAMREAQQQMLRDFFKQQKDFARREHEFQMRQDNLVMNSLRRQTNELLRTAKQLLNPQQLRNPKQESATEQEPTADDNDDSYLMKPEVEMHESADALEDLTDMAAESQLDENSQYSEDSEQESEPETSVTPISADICEDQPDIDAQMSL
ncbi:mrt [Drosophila busckii]|uniref:Mrt n=1 Tax=Drosophila busckii TaxID=30019 RepID=A0A0M4F6F0_DROBS|nr:transcription factor SPT20 homolog [Drosophila busckii]XP_017848778.1 transcription factor SPT20 homolog [Drosophila busckii]XP_017848779.1 transcription factor SPT20 homolog [Drosophila busckii]ALC47270.1 mrt [Drosophila busckii]